MNQLKSLPILNTSFPIHDKNLHLIPNSRIQKNHLFNNLTELNLFSQYLYNDFTKLNLTKLNSTTNKPSNFFDTVDSSLETSPIDSFLFLRKSTVTSFFMMNLVDMPISLKKSKSLYIKTFEIQTLKLSNLLMRNGKRGLVLKALTFVIDNLSSKWNLLVRPTESSLQWFDLYYILINLNINNNLFPKLSVLGSSDNVLGDGVVYKNRLGTKDTLFFKDILVSYFEDFYPLFNFYIQKTDKSKVKNSRGKVAKLQLLWKYVPAYKRFYQALRWLLKDLKFQKANAFSSRLFNVFEAFCLTPQLSFLWKLRNFVHFYVFRNFKKTLLRTLKSSS